MGYEWTYAQPGSTFADRLLMDGQIAGKVERFRRSAPVAEQRRGEPWKQSAPFYVGYIGTDPVTGEHDTLTDAHRATEAAVALSDER
ncbi:MAG: hypothetical protein JWN67_4685 [Actinomycetia bacterium]|nr:hypothetical protein [Actinomycetes bacterium]